MRNRRQRVVAFGHYGFQNFGDDLFQTIISQRANELWPQSELRIFAPGPNFDDAHLINRRLSQVYRTPTPIGSAIRLATAVSGAAWGETIALCGGSTLQTLSGVKRLHSSLARAHIREFQGLGVSVGPFLNGAHKLATTRFIETFSRLVVRDTPSLELTEGLLPGVAALGGDLAALYRYPSPVRSDEQLHVGIMPCASAAIETHSYIDSVQRTIEMLESSSNRPIRVTVLSLNNRPSVGDDALVRQVANSLHGHNRRVNTTRYIELGVDKTIEVIASMEIALPTRLHGAVVAYLVGTPFAFLEYHDKCAHFSDDIGLPAVLRLNRSSGKGAWVSAALAILGGTNTTMPPINYRARAESAYFGGHDG